MVGHEGQEFWFKLGYKAGFVRGVEMTLPELALIEFDSEHQLRGLRKLEPIPMAPGLIFLDPSCNENE